MEGLEKIDKIEPPPKVKQVDEEIEEEKEELPAEEDEE